MPIYIYQNPKNKKIIEIIQSIHDNHEYIDKDGLKWNRIFTAPQLNTDGTLKGDCSESQFSEYTKKQKGTIGDLWDRSKELSEKREKIYGKDPVKTKFLKDWSSKRKGRNKPSWE